MSEGSVRASIPASVRGLRSSMAVRERCRVVRDFVEGDNSAHFELQLSALPKVAKLVAEVTKGNYPALQIPYHSRWGHFSPEGEGGARMLQLKDKLSGLSPLERGKAYYDLVIISVLLDAGAGMQWKYRDAKGFTIGRSEGLALASFDAFLSGAFSSSSKNPLRVDAEKLSRLTESELEAVFQVTLQNPMMGLGGRTELLKSLGKHLLSIPAYEGRPGGLFGRLVEHASSGSFPAREILSEVLATFSPIWPGRIELHGHNLGDVWRHPAVVTGDETTNLVPFHKLSQWLTYSLIEPLEWHGISVTDLDDLTGLAEYRNGGLFVDGEVLLPKSPTVLSQSWNVGDLAIVEWRALTVNLLDELAPLVRSELGLSAAALPLAKILQGGTWAAGRKLAAEKRSDAGPPLKVISDGTVF